MGVDILMKKYFFVCIFMQNRSNANRFLYITRSVCLSACRLPYVIFVYSDFKDSSTDVHAIWQIQLWCLVTHCVKWERGNLAELLVSAAFWRIERKRFRFRPNDYDSDSEFICTVAAVKIVE